MLLGDRYRPLVSTRREFGLGSFWKESRALHKSNMETYNTVCLASKNCWKNQVYVGTAKRFIDMTATIRKIGLGLKKGRPKKWQYLAIVWVVSGEFLGFGAAE